MNITTFWDTLVDENIVTPDEMCRAQVRCELGGGIDTCIAETVVLWKVARRHRTRGCIYVYRRLHQSYLMPPISKPSLASLRHLYTGTFAADHRS